MLFYKMSWEKCSHVRVYLQLHVCLYILDSTDIPLLEVSCNNLEQGYQPFQKND